MIKKGKIDLGNETACIVRNERTEKTFNKTLVLQHPRFPEIKLFVTVNPKSHINYSEKATTIFSDIVTNLFNGLTELDFMVAGAADSFEYSYSSTRNVVAYLMAEVCKYMESKNSLLFYNYRPYLISSTMILTDGVTASIASIGDDKCYYKEGKNLTSFSDNIENVYVGDLKALTQTRVTTFDYSSLSALFVLSHELYKLMENNDLEKFLRSSSKNNLDRILKEAFPFPEYEETVPCSALGLFQNKKMVYKNSR